MTFRKIMGFFSKKCIGANARFLRGDYHILNLYSEIKAVGNMEIIKYAKENAADNNLVII